MIRALFFSTIIIILCSAMTYGQHPIITYKLGMSKPWTHLFEVEINFKELPEDGEPLDLVLPVWRAGRYVVFDFAGGVQEFSATDGSGMPLASRKIDKSTWRVEKRKIREVTVCYKVYANEFELRTRGLNDEYAFLDGVSAFMFVPKYRSLPLTLIVAPYGDWHVTTGMDGVEGNPFRFTAPNYDHLVDCPLFVGNQKDFEFVVEGKKHVLSILGEGNYRSEDLIEDISKIVKAHKDFWGDLPYERYVFMLLLWSGGGGGTEHINSTIMNTRPFIFTNVNAYRGFLGLVAHEFFHTWNVKRIRPRGISPYDYTKENYSRELWIAEGTTSYYGPRMVVKAGFTTPQKYLEGIPRQVVGDRQRPGNTIQSLSESSFDAWIKYWKETRQSYNAEADYYDRGSDVSMLLDLEIRQRSKNKHSLDDVMRALYKRLPWNGEGYTVDDFQNVCEEFVPRSEVPSRDTGSSLKQFFDDHVHGTKPLDWEKGLLYAGLELKPKASPDRAFLGIGTSDRGDRTRITRVIAGSPAYNAGLNIDDELLALNGYRVRSSDLPARLEDMKPGDRVRITVFRNEVLREFEITLGNPPVPSYSIEKVKSPTKLQKAIYESWLGEKF